jgi:hypothetical protein
MILAKISQTIWFKLGFILLASFLALLFGLIAVTANPIFIGLAAGIVSGVFLLAMPKKTIWLVIALGLTTPALLDMAGHGFSRMLWAIAMLALLLWVPSIFNLVNLNPKHKKNTPLFIWLAIFFACFAVVTTVLHLHSIGELFGGFKRYFQAFGLMLALATLAFTKRDFDQWLKLLLAIALLQLPFALFERFILVPLRGGLAAGADATDIVAGTMGANMEGGSPNSIMVMLVLIAFTFVFSRWKEKLIDTSRMFLFALILLVPLVLGETKVVVIMLPLMSIILLRKDLAQNPAKYLPVFIGSLAITMVFAYIYVYIMLESNFTAALIGSLRYNVEDVGYGTSLLNRTTVMSFWWGLHGWHDPIPFLFGHGLGSSYGAGYDAGHIAQIYLNYGIGLTTVSSILWDLGLIGLLMYVSIYIAAWFQVGRIWKLTNNAQIKADCISIQVGIVLTLFFMVYSDSQVNLIVHEIIIAVMLGYAAFLFKEQRGEVNVLQNHVLDQTKA